MITYYNNNNLILRSMLQSDIQPLVQGFAEQGWKKPYEQFDLYFHQQESKEKAVIIAEIDHQIAGYVTLIPRATTGPFAHLNIPEIVDFNVLIKYQKKGIGNKMMDIVENLAREKSDYVSLSVGLHHGYGTAQRMYVKRGYVPDGSGVWYDSIPLEPYSSCVNDDDLCLYFLKALI